MTVAARMYGATLYPLAVALRGALPVASVNDPGTHTGGLSDAAGKGCEPPQIWERLSMSKQDDAEARVNAEREREREREIATRQWCLQMALAHSANTNLSAQKLMALAETMLKFATGATVH